MPALDYCHPHVVRALEKDGWQVSDRPVKVDTANRTVYIDLEATRRINGNRQHIVLGEIKCFPDRNNTTREIYIALGQYLIYRAVLAERGFGVPIYLAIPELVFETVFDSTVHRAIRDNRIKLLVVNLESETVVRWIE